MMVKCDCGRQCYSAAHTSELLGQWLETALEDWACGFGDSFLESVAALAYQVWRAERLMWLGVWTVPMPVASRDVWLLAVDSAEKLLEAEENGFTVREARLGMKLVGLLDA